MQGGIDFGTSNSTVAVAGDGPARLIALEDGQPTLPSAVFWPDEGAPLFGRAALAAYLAGEDGRLMRGLKSTLGSGLVNESTAIGGRAVALREVLWRYIRHLAGALRQTAPGLSRVVMGRPVHFVDDDAAADAQAEATLAAIARDCGFAEVAFQFEPIAAALHYEQSVSAEELVLIVDIGGGTSDVSVVRVSPLRARAPDRAGDILANDGIRLGGTDFDRALSLAEAMPHLGHGTTLSGGKARLPNHYFLDLATWHRINSLYSPRMAGELKSLLADADRPDLVGRLVALVAARGGHALAMEVERVKIALSTDEAARLALTPLCAAPNPVVTRPRLELALAAGLARLEGLITSVLAQAGVAPHQVETVFLTGGSSGLPMVQAMLRRHLSQARLATGNMLGSVGTGLALDARRRFG